MPVAMTANGDVYARISKNFRVDGYGVLDRSAGVWERITGYPGGVLIGSDADNLVFSKQDGPWTTLQFVPSSGLRSAALQETARVR